LSRRLGRLLRAARKEARGLRNLSGEAAGGAAARQFALLTGEGFVLAVPADPSAEARTLFGTLILRGPPAQAPQKAGAGQAPLRVFKDPERNRAFWRYVLAYIPFGIGFQMYKVGMPYFVSSFTKNILRESNDPRGLDPAALQALIRSSRSLSRIAHWTAQAFSSASIPLFTRKSEGAPGGWLSAATLIRSAVVALIPALFLASGLLSLKAAMGLYLGLVMLQSFFQGVSSNMDATSAARILGAKSVSGAERLKANSILAFVTSGAAVVGPLLAAKAAGLPDFMGKTGCGGALIYGMYSAGLAAAGLLFASIRMLFQKAPDEMGAQGPSNFGEALRELPPSLKDGVRLVLKDRFLRTVLALSLIAALFSDPLIFSILPEFIEALVKSSGAALDLPVLGSLFHGVVSSPMGSFGLMAMFSNLGDIASTLLIGPLRRLLRRFGFASEESLAAPLYLLAAAEAPLFWAMTSSRSVWAVFALFGLQSMSTSFARIVTAGLYQKRLGSYGLSSVPRILAARSFLGILASILSTCLFGFGLRGLPLACALRIAACATTALALAGAVSPWLMFGREQRSRLAPSHSGPDPFSAAAGSAF
jgi:hypothetical protein